MSSATTNHCAKCGGDIGFEIRIIDGASYHPRCAPLDWYTIGAETVAMQERERIYGPGGLRDQFAAAALTGFLSDIRRQYPEREDLEATDWREAAAIDSYRFADAMLEARKAKP